MAAPLAEKYQRQHIARFNRDWRFVGNHPQQQPEGDWRNWLLIGGRGSGKTRAGSEWVHLIASSGDRSDLRIALVAETLGDAREVMIDGVSGICRVARFRRPDFEASRRRLIWPNGAMAQIFSSEDPESLRGPQFHFAWSDELESTFNHEMSITVTYGFHWRMRDEENIGSIRNHHG
ncbi:hypothetical protein DSM25559_1846 [Agrobacterium rosae]|uniref:Uncharacterized protein n=1 Tax=Agrobacterium rosae TaxID=1972867 RepID=A0A1R3TT46_9HYPH|nr:hypothetical protein DSM25559_1846 [Agrobacterium rosae]